MLENFYFTILGGFIAGGFGVLLFFLERHFESKNREQTLLFQIHDLIQAPVYGMGVEASVGRFERLRDIGGLSLLIKDKKLRKEICLYAYGKPEKRAEVEELLKKSDVN